LTVTAQSRRRLLDRMDPRSWDTYADADAVASVIAESAAYRRQAQDLVRVRVAHRWPIGLPVEVLTAAAAGGQRSVTVQGKLARLLGGRQTVLTESRHIVMIDDPQAIADAVERVLGAVETEQVLGSEPAAETK
ncbi:MAG: hypothetical protein L0H41_17640, partial [Microlunatus sp.]|nr:hypothetical protein [Microlunatus sp.]